MYLNASRWWHRTTVYDERMYVWSEMSNGSLNNMTQTQVWYRRWYLASSRQSILLYFVVVVAAAVPTKHLSCISWLVEWWSMLPFPSRHPYSLYPCCVTLHLRASKCIGRRNYPQPASQKKRRISLSSSPFIFLLQLLTTVSGRVWGVGKC